jgi:hypothetical protein
MKKLFFCFLILVLSAGIIYSAPKPSIITQGVTPHFLLSNPALTADSCVTTGLNTFGNKTYIYFSVVNSGDTAAIQNANWSFQSKPSGSNATISSVPSLGWVKFKADVIGMYEVKVAITTSTGTKDTVLKVYAANFVGTGNFQNVPAVYPNCMSCHGSMPAFQNIFNKWKVSGHANIFRQQIDSGSSYYGISCMKCHTTGYDHNTFAENNGFDDKARTLGWIWSQWAPPKTGNWDSLKNKYPSLVAFASIGCESCHGPGGEHALGGIADKIQISTKSGSCGSCHDEPWRHNIYAQWENSLHHDPVYEGRRVSASSRNTLSDCNRCHDGKNFVDFTYNRVDSVALVEADMTNIGCPQCHEPHGNSNTHSLRNLPADTLANGVSFASLGAGKICATCHQARNNASTYITVKGSFSQHWGTHHSVQSDVLIGTNAATFGFPYITGSHKNIPGGCVGCHMAPTTDTGTVQRDKVGGHTWNLHDAASNYDHTTGCLSCHPGKTSFDQFMAPQDFDGDTQVEPWMDEVQGCITNLAIALPPTGIDSISWQMIARDSMNLDLRKAYWNYQMIAYDGSLGMHNPFYAIQVLLTSKNYAVGIQPVGTEIPLKFELSQNYPNPFNPSTKINFALPKAENVTLKIFDITGRVVAVLINQKMEAGKYIVDWHGLDENNQQVASGVYFYQIVAGQNILTKKMIMLK